MWQRFSEVVRRLPDSVLLPAALCLVAGNIRSTGADGGPPADDRFAAGNDAPVPYRDLSRSGAGFYGPGREEAAPEGITSVRLGLLGPARRPAGIRLQEGVALAVSDANAQGGFRGLPYEVVFRADDGPWGMGAKQVAALAYEDSVWVILGGLEGGDAHLAELIAAKVWVPVVTPTASDLTIDYANVPWIFRCFPSDSDQARLLLQYARGRGYERLLVFSEADREGRAGERRIQDAAESWPTAAIDYREYSQLTLDADVKREALDTCDAVLIWGRSATGHALLRALRRAGFNGPVLGPAHLLSAALLTDVDDLGEMVVASPYDLTRDDPRMQRFRKRYEERTGRSLDPVALFAYDATCLVIAAIGQVGLNRALIRDALAERSYEGIAGTFQFDELGGASLEPVLMTSRTGTWRPVD